MRKYIAVPTAILAIALITGMVTGEDTGLAEYKGSKMCQMCHNLMHKEVVEASATAAHPKAMQKADAEGAIVADFSTNTAFTKEQVAYVLGKGRNEQSFLDEDLKVLPAKWDVKSKAWKAVEAVDGATQCVGCHSVNFDPEEKAWQELGVGCEACHGPGSKHMAGDKEAIVNPMNLEQPKQSMVCGQCHSAGKDPSGKFAHPVKFIPGDDLTKVFTDAKPQKPGPNQQYSEHLTSMHATEGVECVDCHEPHNKAKIKAQLTMPADDLCMSCHQDTIKDMASHAPDAPADATCVSCHMPGGIHTFGKVEE